MTTDVVSFCSDLIRCKSVTPRNDDAIEYISSFLLTLGFETNVLTFKSPDGANVIKNLFARYGRSESKILGFLGHSDVVPPGDGWDVDPFAAVQRDGFLIGRGAADMKGGISAFCCAVAQFVEQKFDGGVEFFITGDEEVGSREGIQSVIKWMLKNGCTPHDCFIGEPSSDVSLGDRIYLGHRGSMNVTVKSHGRQGHSAYPHSYKNSLSNLCRYVALMADYRWDHRDLRFPSTNLEPTLLFADNHATNVVPEKSSANLNIRFGGDYAFDDLKRILMERAEPFGLSLEFNCSGDPYYCNDEKLKRLLSAAIAEIVGVEATFSAAGGTSDGRYMAKHCNVIEFGLPDATIHQKNERIKISDLQNLEKIYLAFLGKYFQ
ncbi:MAG: succinyl-diaminopimelate desuccinylase [Holosporaceae bacterium]|jgi:succinyl-diaminopimelate desuccinylase|nr:succinyl-diaminopimelate desuccinylase [Holosporaceae bacterium]